ncbi:Type 1 glutamine amidotransferase-like domain-containing protein [Kribbella sp. CA-293567]|uniref:Type 1 glutamine amidotransferase-like domain-containing protein n=1 Tax=Kribbella sp. CA-293567 TaxID=3002436 RepID=UPI0022DDCBDB|nr:Type 1 glutamine amidotransferase-like domain-containing protein [Kribbella sp. CA-293567]WBQ03610.1 Type 1 glutamine amidotransferase-like domain-containing protein [Kribbella sp. CA-293567]
MEIFLIGGGRAARAAHVPFVEACAGGPIVVFVLDDDDLDTARWETVLEEAGATAVTVVPVSEGRPPQATDLIDAAGIYVAGGLTPGYRDVLVGAGAEWLDAARTAGLVYAGFSAGAAIASDQALVGGWQTEYDGRTLDVCDSDLAEDLGSLTLLPGLGLVPFLVDVHAAQWGTLYRLVHAVLRTGLEGWAIDEGTVLAVGPDGQPRVYGAGAATHVQPNGPGSTTVTVVTSS